MWSHRALCFASFWLLAGCPSATTVYRVDGSRVRGKLVRSDASVVVLRTRDARASKKPWQSSDQRHVITIPRSDVDAVVTRSASAVPGVILGVLFVGALVAGGAVLFDSSFKTAF